MVSFFFWLSGSRPNWRRSSSGITNGNPILLLSNLAPQSDNVLLRMVGVNDSEDTRKLDSSFKNRLIFVHESPPMEIREEEP